MFKPVKAQLVLVNGWYMIFWYLYDVDNQCGLDGLKKLHALIKDARKCSPGVFSNQESGHLNRGANQKSRLLGQLFYIPFIKP